MVNSTTLETLTTCYLLTSNSITFFPETNSIVREKRDPYQPRAFQDPYQPRAFQGPFF